MFFFSLSLSILHNCSTRRRCNWFFLWSNLTSLVRHVVRNAFASSLIVIATCIHSIDDDDDYIIQLYDQSIVIIT